MPNFDAHLVKQNVVAELIDHLLLYRSQMVFFHILEDVYIDLLFTRYRLLDIYEWLTGVVPHPSQTDRMLGNTIIDRSVRRFFWLSLYDQGTFDPSLRRVPDGTRSVDPMLKEHMLERLTAFPFEVAVNTWFATCVVWLQVCNIDQLHRDLFTGEDAIPIQDVTAQYVAGMMEWQYF
jgi:hypothetical protein